MTTGNCVEQNAPRYHPLSLCTTANANVSVERKWEAPYPYDKILHPNLKTVFQADNSDWDWIIRAHWFRFLEWCKNSSRNILVHLHCLKRRIPHSLKMWRSLLHSVIQTNIEECLKWDGSLNGDAWTRRSSGVKSSSNFTMQYLLLVVTSEERRREGWIRFRGWHKISYSLCEYRSRPYP